MREGERVRERESERDRERERERRGEGATSYKIIQEPVACDMYLYSCSYGQTL